MRKYLEILKKTFYLCSTNKKRSINLKFKVMAKYHYYLGCRVYESNERNGFKFRLEVNYKSDDFILFVKDTVKFGSEYRKICRLFNAKKILDYLGYKLEEFCDNAKCISFMEELHILKKDVDKPLTFTFKRLKRFENCIYFY